MATLDELLAQQKELEKQIAAAKAAQQSGAFKEIVDIAKKYDISYADLKPHMVKRRKRRTREEIEADKAAGA
jgi:acetolactate synthase small subunit